MKLFEVCEITHEPIIKILEWIKEADDLSSPLPHAMNLATVEGGIPSSRMVLMKRLSDEGIVFFTDYQSKKGRCIKKNSKVALNFWWPITDKQIRIEGNANKVSKEESDEYFASRPLGSKISAFVSHQSAKIDSYQNLVDEAKKFTDITSAKDIIRPERWGGYLVQPLLIEFWINQTNRLHKREVFEKDRKGNWNVSLLSP